MKDRAGKIKPSLSSINSLFQLILQSLVSLVGVAQYLLSEYVLLNVLFSACLPACLVNSG